MRKEMKILAIIFLVAILLILSSLTVWQLNVYNEKYYYYECRELRIVFNLGITIDEAENLIRNYNVTIDDICEEKTWFEEGMKDVVVAYVVVNGDYSVKDISNRINDEEIVWMCSIDYPDD